MSILDMELSSRDLIEAVIKHHFQFWIDRFPRIKGISFDESMNERYKEEDWDYILEHPNKVHIYWWDNYYDLRIYIHKKITRVSRPHIDWGYVCYTGHHKAGGSTYTLKKMIKDYESTR